MAKKRSNKTAPAEEPGFSLDSLREKLDKCVQLADWVEAAHTHREEFPPDVVKTVLADYFSQYDAMVPGLESAGDEAAGERSRLAEVVAELEAMSASIEAQIDEFKLRKLIGEFTDADFAAREEEVRSTFDGDQLEVARGSITEIDDMLSAVGEVRRRIQSIQEPASVGGAPTSESTPAASGEPEAPEAEAEPEPAAAPPAEEPASDALGEEAYNAGGAVQDEWDVEPPASDDASSDDAGWNGGADVTPEPTPDIATSESEDLMATGVIQAQPGIADAPAPPVHSTAEFGGGEASAPPGDGPRLAVTPPDGEQVIYPFSGDVMSLGRGRNNDIQIKNDGKISRYHCRIFRRGDEFIVEDNKSSNGTLVDGKLVTRQRLEGGEVVQLGETRVQFFAS